MTAVSLHRRPRRLMRGLPVWTLGFISTSRINRHPDPSVWTFPGLVWLISSTYYSLYSSIQSKPTLKEFFETMFRRNSTSDSSLQTIPAAVFRYLRSANPKATAGHGMLSISRHSRVSMLWILDFYIQRRTERGMVLRQWLVWL